MAEPRHSKKEATRGPVARDLGSAPQTTADEEPARPRRRFAACVRHLVPLLALLVVLAGEVVELRARGSSQGAYDRLNLAYGVEADSQAIKLDEVRQIVGRTVDEFNPATGMMIFRWDGALKTYALYVQGVKHMQHWYVRDFALNNDPRAGAAR